MKYLIVDASNFLWRNRFALIGKKFNSTKDMNNFALHVSINSLNALYNKHKPDKVVLCFDHGPYWRKEILPTYKGNRQKLSKSGATIGKDPESMEIFFNQVGEFSDFIDKCTSIISLRERTIEADDFIARWVQNHPGDEHVIVSSDGDFHQLHKHSGVTQWNPMKGGSWVEVEDPAFALFEKCIRGETKPNSDNIPSAFPKVRIKRLQKAWTDSYEMNAIMLTEVPDITNEGKLTKVKDLYERNKGLMDLELQPQDIKAMMDVVIEDGETNPGSYDMFYFLKYLAAHELYKIADDSDRFTNLLSS